MSDCFWNFHSVYSIQRTIFFVVLAFLFKICLGWPPYIVFVYNQNNRTQIYNSLLHNCIDPKIGKIGRTKMAFGEIDPHHHKFWLSNSRCSCKNLEVTLLFVNFSKAFDSIHRGKMEQILLTYDLPKETITAIMMPYKKHKSLLTR